MIDLHMIGLHVLPDPSVSELHTQGGCDPSLCWRFRARELQQALLVCILQWSGDLDAPECHHAAVGVLHTLSEQVIIKGSEP